jgi:hypothetical protein
MWGKQEEAQDFGHCTLPTHALQQSWCRTDDIFVQLVVKPVGPLAMRVPLFRTFFLCPCDEMMKMRVRQQALPPLTSEISML